MILMQKILLVIIWHPHSLSSSRPSNSLIEHTVSRCVKFLRFLKYSLLKFDCIASVVWVQWFLLDVLGLSSAFLHGGCSFWFGLRSLSFSYFFVQGFWFSSVVFNLVFQSAVFCAEFGPSSTLFTSFFLFSSFGVYCCGSFLLHYVLFGFL